MENFFTGSLYDRMVNMVETRTKYSVLSHGDCWIPNFLFKYNKDGSQPIAAKMIDFQLARFASPALDISFFIYSCTEQELRENHYDDLLKAYHKSAAELIRSFGLDPEEIFPYSGLMEEMNKFGQFGVGVGIEAVPVSVLDIPYDPELIDGEDAVPIEKIWVLKPIENKDGRRRLADVFKHAVQMGYI